MYSIETNTILIHYGELGLKGHNRRDFENKLKKNISSTFLRFDIEHTIDLEHRYYILTLEDPGKIDQTLNLLHTIFGISWFAPTHVLPPDASIDAISEVALSLASHNNQPECSFRVTAKRANKNYPYKSPEIERAVGQHLKENTYCKINLKKPDFTYFIEINHNSIHVYADRHEGVGGLPVGTSGRALALLSGGFDSPVAAYLMAKRGCDVDFLHFYVSKPDGSSKIVRLSQHLSQYTQSRTLYLAPYLPFSLAITDIKTNYELALFRRFTLKIAEKIAREKHYDAIVTGDSLGQVASQTLENIIATDDALDQVMCFRPLIGMDKREIISLDDHIGVSEIAKEPEKDCCSIIDRHAKTRVSIEKIREEETKLENYNNIVEDTFSELDTLTLSNK